MKEDTTPEARDKIRIVKMLDEKARALKEKTNLVSRVANNLYNCYQLSDEELHRKFNLALSNERLGIDANLIDYHDSYPTICKFAKLGDPLAQKIVSYAKFKGIEFTGELNLILSKYKSNLVLDLVRRTMDESDYYNYLNGKKPIGELFNGKVFLPGAIN